MANSNTRKTAFVLAGGGSFGAIQVDMLRELVGHGIQPNFVVGSSVGALNGAYFAGDPTAAGAARLENIWRGLKRRDVFQLTLRRLAGLFFETASLVDSGGLCCLIERHLPYRELENAAIPVHIAARRRPPKGRHPHPGDLLLLRCSGSVLLRRQQMTTPSEAKSSTVIKNGNVARRHSI